MTSYKELQRLAGFTSLVSELEAVLQDLDAGKYQRTMLTAGLRSGLHPGAGVVSVDEERIAFTDCPIVTPNGDLLVDHVSFTVSRGQNLMIVGPNGCGQTQRSRSAAALRSQAPPHLLRVLLLQARAACSASWAVCGRCGAGGCSVRLPLTCSTSLRSRTCAAARCATT